MLLRHVKQAKVEASELRAQAEGGDRRGQKRHSRVVVNGFHGERAQGREGRDGAGWVEQLTESAQAVVRLTVKQGCSDAGQQVQERRRTSR